MRKNLLLLLINGLVVMCAGCDFLMKYNPDLENEPDPGTQDTISNITDADYIIKVDEYVNYVRENIEETSIVKKDTETEKTVLFVKESDTVKISVLAENNANTDIYFQNSTPVFMSRDIILDVDSNYMETAYLKHGKILKCFRDGMEIMDPNDIRGFEKTLGDK